MAGLLFLSVPAPGVELRFVPPSAEGTVSLGISDSAGQLVRVLCDEWPVADFTAGLNGLSVEWDGRDASGQPVPAGTYAVKGFHMGNVEVSGEAIHFNDWITTEDAPRIEAVASLGILAGGDLLMASRLTGDRGALLRYSPHHANPWAILACEPLPASPRTVKLAVAGDRVFVLVDNKIRALDLATGREIEQPGLAAAPVDVGGHEDRLTILTADGIKVFDATNLKEKSALPPPPVKVAAVAPFGREDVVAAGEDGSLWHGAPEWRRLDAPPGTKALAVAAGRGQTFWVLERGADGSVVVVQYSPEEGRLAEWVASTRGDPVALAASADADYFAAIFAGPEEERTVAIRRSAEKGWELLADKTITASGAFGVSEGRLSPVGESLPAEITVGLRENPLDASAPRSLVLRASASVGGTGLVTAEGLPLVSVSNGAGFKRVALVAGRSGGTARFYQGDGACVEQFNLVNLDDITALDAGTIEMEGGAEKAPPPEEDPEEPMP
jgi:hypothetical protein